jgi:Fur family ferric uptake transcriptional regulator
VGTQAVGNRATKQRAALLTILEAEPDFRSAQEVHAALQSSGESVGLATVYRNLALLADLGQVDCILADDGQARYRRCSDTHHHHLVCRECGRTVEVAGPAVERWANTVAEENGFRDVSHRLELFGVCPACAAKK